MIGFKKWRRGRLKKQPFPAEWIRILQSRVALYDRLPADQRQRLHGHIHVFLNEKNFEGCGGITINEEMRLTIAAQACLLMLADISDYFPTLRSILVYPDSYHAPVQEFEEGGIVTEGHEWRQGEAWDMGSMVLSWKNVKRTSKHLNGKNLVLHEFAHLLDSELGATENWQPGSKNSIYANWSRTLNKEYKTLLQKVGRNEPVLFDVYGASSLVEFFAVATECFFEKPQEMMRLHPDLYEQLQIFYGLDTIGYG
ncbi:MAG: M90 family metallopeptidase [Balneolales bacterium]